MTLKPGQAAVTRDCWECGRQCQDCTQQWAKTCKRCKSSYCYLHNTGCDEKIVRVSWLVVEDPADQWPPLVRLVHVSLLERSSVDFANLAYSQSGAFRSHVVLN